MASIGTRESILATIFDRLGVVSEEHDDDAEEEDEILSGDSTSNNARSGVFVHEHQETTTTFSLHQEMYAPLVRLPPHLASSETPYVYEGYRHTPVSRMFHLDEALLASDTDEEALAAELRQEEELNKRDLTVAEAEENKLWGEYSHRVTRGGQDAHALRFKAPGTDRQVKSQVYVVDSDSE